MAITGTFAADFGSFYDAVQRAQVSLKGFESDSTKVSQSLSRMADAFSGRKILEDGAQLNRLFATTADIALLTDKELRQVGETANEAVEKMNRLGIEVPQNLQRLASETQKTRTTTEGLHTSMSRFDGILGALGLNISSEIRAFGEMSTAMGSTIGQLGLLATAGIAAGAAIGAYGLTRAFLSLIGVSKQLDDAVAKNASSLLGLGNVTKEAAGAQQDVLAKASAIAGHEIASLTEAMKINEEWVRKHNLAVVTSKAVIGEWKDQIARVKKDGEFEQLTTDIKSHAFEMDVLQTRYKLSAGALELVIADMKAAEDETKRLNEDVQGLFKAWAEGDKVMEEFRIKTHKVAMDSFREEATERKRSLDEMNKSVLEGLKSTQAIQQQNTDFVRKQTMSETDFKILKIREWEAETIAAFRGTEQQLNVFTQAVRERAQQQVDALSKVAEIVTLIGGGSTSLVRPDTQSRIHSGLVGGTGGFSLGPAFSLAGRASGGPVSAGQTYLVGERGPEVLHMGAPGFVGANASGVSVTNHFHIVDTEANIARRVSAQITQSIKSATKWGVT